MTTATSGAGIPERFVVERQLGSGGFGSVLAVHDRERNQRVALKRLERVDPNSVYRFKQEFRGLMDIVHPNLVRLHELFARDQVWCFTMDYIDGVRFDTHVRGLAADSAHSEATWSSGENRSATTRPEKQQ
ncbi:MAG TPA: protein kinase, partial [Polyangiaceae bacterium]|nr:protein kinase [Polyangiaceae bacterium]